MIFQFIKFFFKICVYIISWYAIFINFVVAEQILPEQMVVIQNAIKQLDPNLDLNNANISVMPELDLYKIIGNKNLEVFFISKNGRYFFYGDLIDLQIPNKNNRNITDVAKRIIRKSELANFNRKNMLVFKPDLNSWGLRRPLSHIMVFTDLNCPYGNRFHQEVKKVLSAGLEVRYLFLPRGGVDSESYKKSVAVWCAKNPQQAFALAADGKESPQINCSKHPINQQLNLGLKLGIHGTPSIILSNGRLIPGFITADQLLKLVKENDADLNS